MIDSTRGSTIYLEPFLRLHPFICSFLQLFAMNEIGLIHKGPRSMGLPTPTSCCQCWAVVAYHAGVVKHGTLLAQHHPEEHLQTLSSVSKLEFTSSYMYRYIYIYAHPRGGKDTIGKTEPLPRFWAFLSSQLICCAPCALVKSSQRQVDKT